jgi:hypothetical protein
MTKYVYIKVIRKIIPVKNKEFSYINIGIRIAGHIKTANIKGIRPLHLTGILKT